MSDDRASSRIPARRTARLVALAAFLLFAFTGGGRISAATKSRCSSCRGAMLHGGIAVPEGATPPGPDGKFYSKNTAGQAVLALPLVAVGEGRPRRPRGFRESKVLASRFVASFLNAIVTAVLLGAFYAFARRLGVRTREALAATAMLGFSRRRCGCTRRASWPSRSKRSACCSRWQRRRRAPEVRRSSTTKTAARGSPRSARSRRERQGEHAAARAAVARRASGSSAGSAGSCRCSAWRRRRSAGTSSTTSRFHDVLQSGYGAQQSASAFSTPLLVGLYGCCCSSDGGVLCSRPRRGFFAGFRQLR